MFNCSSCRKPIGPKVSPILVPTLTRLVEYFQKDEKGVSHLMGCGTEIVKEAKLCPTCAKVPAPTPMAPNFAAFLMGRAMQAHGAKCQGKTPIKKAGKKIGEEECKVCKVYALAWLSMPVDILNLLLTEAPAHVRPPSFASRAIDKLIDRTNHNSKRAKADTIAGMAILSAYEANGGGL